MKSLHNPLEEDFTHALLDDNNQEVAYTIPALYTEFFPDAVYDRLEKHLVDAVANHRQLGLYDMVGLAKIKADIHPNG